MSVDLLLELLTKGPLYEMHAPYCARFTLENRPFSPYGEADIEMRLLYAKPALKAPCNCSGPDLLKQIKEALIQCRQQVTI